jgi:site-specific DNA-cytosine methylase
MDQIRERIWIIAHNPNAVCLRQQRERETAKEPWSREQFEGLVSTDLRMCISAGRSGGVSYGLPNRSHRLKGLGNAIVPQVATVILKAMARTPNIRS